MIPVARSAPPTKKADEILAICARSLKTAGRNR